MPIFNRVTALLSMSPIAVMAGLFACGSPHEDVGVTEARDGIGPDGAEFVTVAVPGDHCKSVVLRGTSRFNGRAFVLPQPYVAANSQGTKLFQVIPKAGGGYVVRIGVFFPAGRTDTGVASSIHEEQPDCEYTFIRDEVNRSVPDADKIGLPEPLSVNNMVAKVQGLPGEATIGSPSTDILAYSGKDYVLEFDAADDVALSGFLTRLRSTPGVQLSFDVHFTARASEGFTDIHVSLSRAADRLDAALTAGGSIRGVMLRGDFEVALARAIAETSVDVYIEQSRDQAFADLTKELVRRIVTENAAITTTALPAIPDGGVAPSTNPSEGAIASIDVRAALQALRAKAEFSYRVTLMGGNVQRTFSTNAIVRSNWADPGTEYLRAYSDGTDAQSMFSQNLTRGMILTIAPQPRSYENIRWSMQSSSYYTKEGVLHDEYSMPQQFTRLQSWPGSLVQKNDFPVYMYDGWYLNVANWSYFTWGWETAVSAIEPAGEVPTTMDDPGMRIEFAGSRRFSLRDLATSNDYWDARVDDVLGQISIVVKQNLQQLKLKNEDALETAQIYPVRRFEKYWSGGGDLKSTTYSAADATRTVPTRRSFVQVRVHAETPGVGSVDPSSIEVRTGAGGIIRAPH